MSVPLMKYPLDLTGKAVSNLITGEVHDLSGLSSKAFVPKYGPYYTGGLVVRNNATGQPLTPKTQYIATQLFVDMTLRTGLDICSIIVITDTTLPSDLVVSIDYQVLGGEYSASVDAIQQLIDALGLGNQPVMWADIVGKPVLFPPAPHLHDLGDIYGFEYIVAALERVTQAIYIGDAAQLQAIYQYIDHQIGVVQGDVSALSAQLTAHLADYTNPHRVTKSQVGLGSVDNYATATNADGVAGTASNLFMTPAVTTAAIAAQVGNAFAAHIADHNNPHQTTAAQIGLGNVNNYGWASTADAQAGVSTTGYMNPALTTAAISQQALVPLNAHINNLSNPHNVTKAQVGLGNVNNYGTASNTDGITGTSTTLYMTPAATTAAIGQQALVPLNAHINNTSNPHNVTKTQVGLGNVDNTSDVNKPVSTAQQTALNTKATLGAAVNFATVVIGNDNNIIYESSPGAITIRHGTSAGWNYSTFALNGDVSLPGAVYAGRGFQPSDVNLKDAMTVIEPRPLWRETEFYEWIWKQGTPMAGKYGRGTSAQEALMNSPEYVDVKDTVLRKGQLHLDYVGMMFEMVLAAGREIDRLLTRVSELESRR